MFMSQVCYMFKIKTMCYFFCISGFTNFNESCCPTMSEGFCVRDSTPCPNRDEYIYYDGIHPTSAVNNITASLAYDSTDHPDITSPMDIKHLAQLVI